MPRPLRFVPEGSLIEITTRTIHGRRLLKPSPELTDIILGIIGKAQDFTGMVIHAFVFLSTHAHFLLSPEDAGQLAKFMQFVNANVAKEAGRLHRWREKFWSRRYRSIVVADETSALGRLRYIMAHGAKEGLIASPALWPGPHCLAALTNGASLRGTWFDRTAESHARQRGETVCPSQFAKTFGIELTPLPRLQHLSPDQRQAEYRRIVDAIKTAAEVENKEKKRTPMTVEEIIAQDPHGGPAELDRSPAPFVHAADRANARHFRQAYRDFADAFRAGRQHLRDRARNLTELFPLWSFPPPLPFNAPA